MLAYFRGNGFLLLLMIGSHVNSMENQHLPPVERAMNCGSLYWKKHMQNCTALMRPWKVG